MPCIVFDEALAPANSIFFSQSFGANIVKLESLEEAFMSVCPTRRRKAACQEAVGRGGAGIC